MGDLGTLYVAILWQPVVALTHTCFLRQYDVLNRILSDVEALAEKRSFVPASLRFGEFRIALEKHLRDEERVLLPQFVQEGGDATTVARISSTHTQILRSVNNVGEALSQAEYSYFCTSIAALDRVLEAHRHDEETVVHPALDRVLRNDADWDSLRSIAYLREFPLDGAH